MIEIKVTLPDWAGEYIQGQIKSGRCASADELIAALLDEERAIATDERLAELIQEGLDSGEGTEVNDQWWEQIDEKVRQELQRRQSA
jgi:antitoxin ParD1/3/4